MAVFSYLATTAIWAGVSASIGAAAAGAIIAAGQAVTWSIASAMLNKPAVSRQTVQATLNQPEQARIRAYGRNLMGGVRALFEADDGQLHQIIVFHHGPVDGLIRPWFNGEPREIDGNGLIRKYVYLFFRDGSGAGGDYQLARDKFPDLWTPAHRLEGQATFYPRYGNPSDANFPKVFPKSDQTPMQVEVRASRVRNLAGDLVYSENAGLCLRDLLTHPDGWNIPSARIDPASVATFVALCDEPVPLKAGGTEPRYRLCGFYSLDDPLKDVTARMLATCDGQIYQTAEGKVGILGGAWSEPDVTLTGADILSVREMNDGFDPFTDYNILRGSFISPDHAYQPTEVQDLRDDAALALHEERSDHLEADMCPSAPQLQRLMKIRFAKDHREQVGTITTNLVGMKARFPKGDGIHTIRIVAEGFGIDGIFEVTSHSFSIPDGTCTIGIASLRNPYGWNAVTEEKPLPPTLDQIRKPGHAVPVPKGVVLTQEPVTVSGDITGVKLVVQVDDPAREDLELRAQIARGDHSGTGPILGVPPRWVEMPADQLRAESGLLDDGEAYTVRIMWRGYGDWIKVGSLVVLANPEPPPAPMQVAGRVAGATAVLSWVNAPRDYYRTQILMGTTATPSAAEVVATVAGTLGRTDTVTHDLGPATASRTRHFWWRTLNRSGVPSGLMGPITLNFAPA